MIKQSLNLLTVLFIVSCASSALTADVPAVIDKPNEATNRSLTAAVSAALAGRKLLLAKSALTQTNQLIIENSPPQSLTGKLAGGLVPPENFKLFLHGTECVLVRQADGSRTPLPDIRCRPL